MIAFFTNSEFDIIYSTSCPVIIISLCIQLFIHYKVIICNATIHYFANNDKIMHLTHYYIINQSLFINLMAK